MKIYSIIPYWLNTSTGETRVNNEWIYMKVCESYNELYEWAQNNKESLYFRADNVFDPNEINDSKLKFDFSIKEVSDIFVKDLLDNEYRANIQLISKIEFKRIEVPIIK